MDISDLPPSLQRVFTHGNEQIKILTSLSQKSWEMNSTFSLTSFWGQHEIIKNYYIQIFHKMHIFTEFTVNKSVKYGIVFRNEKNGYQCLFLRDIVAWCRLRDSRVREIEKARTRKYFRAPFIWRHPHYLRAWKRDIGKMLQNFTSDKDSRHHLEAWKKFDAVAENRTAFVLGKQL